MNPDPKQSSPPVAPPGTKPPTLARRKKAAGRGLLWTGLAFFALFLIARFSNRQEEPLPAPAPPPTPAPVWRPPAGGFRPRPTFSPPPNRQIGSVPTRKQPRVRDEVTGPRAAAPQYSSPGGIFAHEVTVEIKPGAAAGTVRYTLDGSEPSSASPEYSGPITVGTTTLVKAKSFEPGVAPSVTVAQTYTMLDASLTDFTSNLPLVIVNAFGQPITKESAVAATLDVIQPEEKRSALTGPGGFHGRCEIKMRGFSSLRLPKHSFSIKTLSDGGASLDVPMLGMPKDSDWVLYAPYSDKSLMRDVLAYNLSNRMGRYAARTRFVEVFLQRGSGKLSKRDYVGVYVLEEKIKRGKERVNIQKLTPEDKTEPNITGGYLFKRDHTSPPMMDGPFNFFGQNQMSFSGDDIGFNTSRGVHFFYVDPKETEITPAQKAYLSKYLSQFERALYGPGFKSPTEGYAKYLDADSFIDQFWIVELSKNIDGFRYSCYMTKDREGKIRVEPIWDWNLSFGNANYHQGWISQNWYWPLLRENEISWFRRLRQDPEFMQRLIDRWWDLRRSVFAPEDIFKRVDEFAAELNEAQERNFSRWPILGQQVNPNWFVGESFEEEVTWMKNWIQERIAWIDSQFLPPPAVSRSKQSAAGPAVLTLEGAGQIYYTLDGSDPRVTGGDTSPSALEYKQPITLTAGNRLSARLKSADNWSGLVRFPAPSRGETDH